ncbi:hypothetical protein MUK42_03327 [Musa troglodytarum]|uniref:Uncharacterized protein n=1 Tax=Musa troglodytarum TaxID=320322 RepID=A0A9E7G2C5_9LILI|nr:hypothetical protein MUK42_03327 [Musa troglodytarum]
MGGGSSLPPRANAWGKVKPRRWLGQEKASWVLPCSVHGEQEGCITGFAALLARVRRASLGGAARIGWRQRWARRDGRAAT